MKYLIILSILVAGCKKKNTYVEPWITMTFEEKLDPKNALLGLEVADSLEVALFAAEPMLTNPTDIDVDARGRVWVCESFNYRNPFHPENPYKKKGDRIMILEDLNEDGKADTSKVFYQGEDVNAALGIAVLGNKVLVSCAPNVFVLTDTNGDDVADKKEILFKGIKGFQDDHSIHTFLIGPEGKLYFNMGNHGEQLLDKNGKIVKDRLGRPIITNGKPYRDGLVLRCNLDGTDVDVVGYNFRNNYEVTVDSHGRMFQSDNDDDGSEATRINNIMDYGNYGYKDELTGASWQTRRTNMEDSIPMRHWHQDDPGVIPNMLYTGAGSPGGITINEGSGLLAANRGKLIHAESYFKEIKTYSIQSKGAGYTSGAKWILRGRGGNDWFRPSDVSVAPDGSLMVADWFDGIVGGHNLRDTLRGRIFRVHVKGKKGYHIPKSSGTPEQIALEQLKSPNFATRFLGLTVLKETKNTEKLYKELNSKELDLASRVLGVLFQIPKERDRAFKVVCQSPNLDLIETALRLKRSIGFNTEVDWLKLAQLPSDMIKREVALSMKFESNTIAIPVLKEITKTLGNDRWLLEAIGIGAENKWDALMPHIYRHFGSRWQSSKIARDMVWRSRAKSSFDSLIVLIKNAPKAEVSRYFRATDFVRTPHANQAFYALSNSPNEHIKLLAVKHLEKSYTDANPAAKQAISGIISNLKNELDYFDLVKKFDMVDQSPKLEKMVISHAKSAIAAEAGALLVHFNQKERIRNIILNAETRQKGFEAFGQKNYEVCFPIFAELVLDQKQPDTLKTKALWAIYSYNGDTYLMNTLLKKLHEPQRTELLNIVMYSWNVEERKKALRLLFNGSLTPPKLDGNKVLAANGDKTRGKAVFETYCKTCHIANGNGVDFGPNLSKIGQKLGKDGLFASIVNPNAGINFGYEGHTITTTKGDIYVGLVHSKTNDQTVIKMMGTGELKTILNIEISKDETMKASLMPQMALKEQEMIDLLSFLSGLK